MKLKGLYHNLVEMQTIDEWLYYSNL
jgi:hypothetical protein